MRTEIGDGLYGLFLFANLSDVAGQALYRVRVLTSLTSGQGHHK